jgi:putative ABC transport system permease protein
LDDIPGVRMSAIGLQLPTDDNSRGWMRAADVAEFNTDTTSVVFQVASNSYFETLGIPIVAGRTFDARDAAAVPPTLILSESVARQLFGSSTALGKKVFTRSNDEDKSNVDSAYEIVGVAADIRPPGPSRRSIPHVYIPFVRLPVPHITVLVRSMLPPASIGPSIDRVLTNLNEGQPLRSVRPLNDMLAQMAARPRFYLLVLGTFALTSLVLTSVGIYSLTSFTVHQRTKEIGMRAALGASRGGILLLMLRDNARPLAIGTALGVGGSFLSTRLLAGLLAGVKPNDPLSLLVSALLLLICATAATLIPAFRASHVDPLAALRTEA